MTSAAPDQVVVFGPFRLCMPSRKLFCANDEVRVGDRAMDILLTLARRKGELVTKEQLFAAAWPGVFVQEANLKVTVAYLRRALRGHAPPADYINNIVGRGYWLDTKAEPVLRPAGPARSMSDPEAIVGRASEIAEIGDALEHHRLVTIVGAGGIGKTTVAQAVAHRAGAANCPVTVVDFSRVGSEDYVASSLASALGISAGGDSLQAIISIVARQKMLLVFDTCEHVPNAVAHICDVILARTRAVRILATSRQLLRARDEKVVWLTPLAAPAADQVETARDLLRYPASELLSIRVAERGGEIDDGEAHAIGEICRRVDGSPLAIELVASRLAGRAAAEVLDELDARFLTFRRDGGDGPQRQQTLLMTMQWSYALLGDVERRLLRALSIFAGSFDLSVAAPMVAGDALAMPDVLDAIAGLRAKSMLVVCAASGPPRYRLLDSTRAFARELLDGHGETAAVAERHARLTLDRIGTLGASSGSGDWRMLCSGLADELRGALDWTLARSANPLLGIELAAAGLPLWHELSLGEETRVNCERALSEFGRIGCNDASLKLRLLVGLARVSTYVATDGAKVVRLFREAAALARQMDDPGAECRILGALATYELMPGRGGAVAETLMAMDAAAARSGDPAARREVEQLRAQWEIRRCDFGTALVRVETLFDTLRADEESAAPRFQIHQKMNVEVQLAALNWLRGRPGEAVRIAAMAARDAEDAGHGLTLIHCLAQGIAWTLIQCRQFDDVRPYVAKLRQTIYRHGMAAWIPVANCYDAVVAAMAGERPDPEQLRSAYAGVREGMIQLRHDARYAMFAEAMLANGQMADAARVVRDVFETSAEPWGKSEFLRLRAATERASGRDAEARATLEQALATARAIGCPPWELRAAYDLALLLNDNAAPTAARHALMPCYARFGDDFATGDLDKARILLARLG